MISFRECPAGRPVAAFSGRIQITAPPPPAAISAPAISFANTDVGGLVAGRYVHLGLVARLARLKVPEGRDGDIALAVAATRALAAPSYPFDEQTVRAMAARDEVSGVRDTAAQSRQAGAKWHDGRLSQLRVPALVLHGSDDPLLRPAAARHTAKAISGARLVILPGVGHYLPAEVFPQIAGEVRALADRAASAPSRPPGSCWTW